MKDSLKDFIKSNREAFDDKVPGDRVWKKIEARLPQMKVVSLWNSGALWRVAAVVFMGLSLVMFLGSGNSTDEKSQAIQLKGEFKDLESFYTDEIAKKVALIDDFGGAFESKSFTQDLEKLDAMYQVLRELVSDSIIFDLRRQ